ncbi:36.4 kDa proline-rich protein-like [Typha latifolia]|uniref:36.4 kDa proline-rich protein-like n=1 Tax=Typha latifolia TaxID=4733 RepID=UPI003C2BA674
MPPAIACDSCSNPKLTASHSHRPRHAKKPPIIPPPIVVPPLIPPPATCSLDILKLGLCLDVLGALVHVGLAKPVEDVCCPVLEGLLELEAALCMCSAIKLKVLNLDIYIPLALQVLVSCGKDPPAGYLCPLN